MSMRSLFPLCSVCLLLLEPVGARALEHPPTLNSTGRAINMPVPLRSGGDVLGDIIITIDEHDQVLVAAADLAPLLKEHLPENAMRTLEGFGPAPLPLILFADLDGLSIGFDHQAMELTLSLPSDKSKPRVLSLSGKTTEPTLMQPATVSAFLNYNLLLTHDWSFEDASGFSVDLEAASRFGGVVFEGEGRLGGSLNGFLCPIEAKCQTQHETAFARLGTRAVYDWPDWDTRAIAGDATFYGVAGQRPLDGVGLTLEHNPELFAKSRSQSTRSFDQMLMLDRPADLQLIVNGIPMQRMALTPGAYSLRDLPIMLGANAIEAVITYDTGEQDIVRFDALSNYQLLDAGQITWGVSGGLPSTWIDGQRHYLSHFQGGLYLRHGLSDAFTSTLALQTDSTVHNAGLGLHHLTGVGTLHVAGTLSYGSDVGYAVSASFETLADQETQRSLRLSADYYSEEFRQPGDAQLLESDVLFPTHDAWLRLSAIATSPLVYGAYTTATARYDFAAERPNLPGSVSAGINRWSIDVGISRTVFDSTTLSFTAGYGNDRLLSFSHLDEDPEFRLGLSLYARLGDTSLNARHSFGNDVSSVTASHSVRSPSDIWQATVTADNAPERGLYSTSALSHLGQRSETRLSHTVQKPQDYDEQHRTQLQHAGAIAFANGKVALGAPIRNGFAIVYPHDTIQDADVFVGTAEAPRATGSSWFPAIVTDLPAYAQVQYPLGADNIPEGYALGSSHLNVRAPYRSGYAVQLGSDMAVTAYGTLLDANGSPLSLQSGTATSGSYAGRAIDVFTNSHGRFAIEGLAHGDWVISIGAYSYTFIVPRDAAGLVNVDAIEPDGTSKDGPQPQWPTTLLTEAQ